MSIKTPAEWIGLDRSELGGGGVGRGGGGGLPVGTTL